MAWGNKKENAKAEVKADKQVAVWKLRGRDKESGAKVDYVFKGTERDMVSYKQDIASMGVEGIVVTRGRFS